MLKTITAGLLLASLLLTNINSVRAQQIAAQLLTTANYKIQVNGSDAATGDSVLSGSQISVPGNVGAILVIGSWGKIELMPGTRSEVFFQNNDIRLVIHEGCSILTTAKGTTGKVINSDGNLLRTNDQGTEGDMQEQTFRRIPHAPAQSDGKLRRYLPICNVREAIPNIPDGAVTNGLPRGIFIAGGTGLGALAVGLIISGTRGGGGEDPPVSIVTGGGGTPSPSGL